MSKFRPSVVESEKRYDKIIEEGNQTGADLNFTVGPNMKSTYSMFGYVFQEIANIRLEVSRLGLLVRLNNSNSPDFLIAYHSHLYSFLIPVSVLIADDKWSKIKNMWLDTKTDIDKFLNQRRVVPNKRIPFEIIDKLDKLYRIALLVAQYGGLGIQIDSTGDVDAAIEKAIIGG